MVPRLLIALTLILAWEGLCASEAAAGRKQPLHVFEITVAKHPLSPNDGNGRNKLSIGSGRLQEENAFCADVCCCVELMKIGATGTFGSAADGLDVITSSAEMDAVLAVNTHQVKIVNVIAWCNTPGAYAGCTVLGQRNMVMTPTSAADTWVHEFGHAKGLGHTGCNTLIMTPGLAPNRNAVTAAQCVAYRSNPDRVEPTVPCGARIVARKWYYQWDGFSRDIIIPGGEIGLPFLRGGSSSALGSSSDDVTHQEAVPKAQAAFLGAAHPNPFRSTASIEFGVVQSGRAAINVYDVKGRLVRSIFDEDITAGSTSFVSWDGLDESGRLAPSGVYFYRLTTGNFEKTRRMVLLH